MKYRAHNRDAGLFDYQQRVDELKARTTTLDRLDQAVDWERGCFQIGLGNLVYNLFRSAQLGSRIG